MPAVLGDLPSVLGVLLSAMSTDTDMDFPEVQTDDSQPGLVTRLSRWTPTPGSLAPSRRLAQVKPGRQPGLFEEGPVLPGPTWARRTSAALPLPSWSPDSRRRRPALTPQATLAWAGLADTY